MYLQWHGLGPVATGQTISQTDNTMNKRTTTKKAGERTFAPIILPYQLEPLLIAKVLNDNHSQREIADLCRERSIPIKKYKFSMCFVLAQHIAAHAKEIILVIR